jgi:molecular chaperone GrpE
MPNDDAEKPRDGELSPDSSSGDKNQPAEDIEGLEDNRDEVEYVPLEKAEKTPEKEAPKKAGLKPLAEDERSLKGKLKHREAELKALKKELEELKDKYLRKLAEMENLRKRFDRERLDYVQYALSEFLREWLVVLDNFERALGSRDQSDGKSLQEGVDLIYRQCLDLLKKKGVRPMEIKDRKFDPSVHQAVMTEESDGVEEPEIGEVLQRGYWIQDRLLRPALVKVLIPKRGGPS